MQIKITSCSKPTLWYSECIGFTYPVKEEYPDAYLILKCPTVEYWVLAKDCEVVNKEQEIYIWPDGSWMYAGEYCPIDDSWRGEDYLIEYMPEYWGDIEIEHEILKIMTII